MLYLFLDMNDHKNNLKIIKKVLADKYGFKNVSVTNGTGTAWGWVQVKITVNGATDGVRQEAEKIIKETGIELYKYSTDYGPDRDCLLVDVYSK